MMVFLFYELASMPGGSLVVECYLTQAGTKYGNDPSVLQCTG